MSVTALFTPENSVAGYTPAPVPSDFGEIAGSSFDYMRTNLNVDAALRLTNEEFRARDDLIRERFGQEPFDITAIKKQFPNPSSDGRVAMETAHQSALDRWILAGRESNPDSFSDVPTTGEVEERARDKARLSKRHFEDVMQRARPGFGTGAAAVIGGIGGGFTDPLNLATLPIGAGASRSILKAALIEGTLNAAVETASLPAVMAWQKEVGHKYGLSEAAGDVGLAFVGGAGLTTVLRGAVPALRKTAELSGSVSQSFLTRLADSERLPGSVRDAARYMSRVAHVDEGVPLNMRSEFELQAHRQAVQSTAQALERFEEPSFEKYISTLEDFDFRARAGGRAGVDVERLRGVARHFDDSVAVVQEGVFASRKEADDFVRVRAKETGTERARFVVGRTDDGQSVTVSRPVEGVEPLRDDVGEVRQFKSHAEAKAFVEGLKDEKAAVISLNPEAGKAGQVHLVLRGADDAVARAIKEAPERVAFIKQQPARPASSSVFGIPAKERAATASSEKVVPLHRTAEAVSGVEPSMRQAAREADFNRALASDPDTVITLDDGSRIRLGDLAEDLKGDRVLLDAMKGCALG